MIRFLLKGVFRDRHRSLFPMIAVFLGVMLTVLLHCWITGVMGDMVDFNARFSTGHVKIMSRAYADNADQVPNDLALLGAADLVARLRKDYPSMTWVQRIRFGGLLDAPDANGETRAQGPVAGLAVDLLSEDGTEVSRLNIDRSVVRGRMPKRPGEILISDDFARALEIRPGQSVTLISSTMNGSMAMQNFIVSGTVRFGVQAMDRGAMIADISDARLALDMDDAAGEILGYFPGGAYNDTRAAAVTDGFNARYAGSEDEFAPVMMRLTEQNDLGSMLDYVGVMITVFVAVFVSAMSLVLWNAGLIGGLRRYGEIGVRLAIGEDKGHVYRSMIAESLCVGFFGSVLGTAVGLGLAFWLQVKGFDMGDLMKNSTMMLPTVFRARITPPALYIGFLPGLFSTVLGTMLSGVGIYRRNTAQLFKELET